MLHVHEDGPLHKYYAAIPNTVIRGLKSVGLSRDACWLYVYIKSIAGDRGCCWQGTATLAQGAKMSSGLVSKCKQELVKAGLIKIRGRTHARHEADEIRIVDIWPLNMQEFSTSPPEADDGTFHQEDSSSYATRLHHMNTPPSPHEHAPSPHEHAPSPHETKKNSLRKTLEEINTRNRGENSQKNPQRKNASRETPFPKTPETQDALKSSLLTDTFHAWMDRRGIDQLEFDYQWELICLWAEKKGYPKQKSWRAFVQTWFASSHFAPTPQALRERRKAQQVTTCARNADPHAGHTLEHNPKGIWCATCHLPVETTQ